MKSALPFCFGLSIGLHLAAAGLWQDAPVPSLGAPGRTLQVTVSTGPPMFSPGHKVVAADTTAPEQILDSRLQTKPIVLVPGTTPASVTQARNIAVIAAASAGSTTNAVTSGKRETAAFDNNANRISAAVRKRLAAYFEYPLVARRHGWEGEVMLGLRLNSNGRMSDIRVVTSSGYRILDRSALQSVRKANIVIETLGWLVGRHVDVVLPVRYRLIDS